MLTKISLALGVLIALLATIPASTGTGNGGRAPSGYAGNMASGGGNLIPLW